MKKKETWYILIICISIISSNSFSQHASFQGLGDFPGGEFNSSAQKVSGDGSVVIGYGTTNSGQQAFRWTESTGMESLGNLPDTSFKKSWANSVSANGNVIVGSGDPGSGWNSYMGFRWNASSGMEKFGSLNGSTRYEAFSVSADGSVIVGDGGLQAFRWTQQSGIEGLGVLPGKTNSRAIDISNDGSVIIGQSYSLPAWNDEDGFIWTQSGGMRGMASLTGGKYCMLLGISPDGSVIAGTTQSSSTYPAFFWTESKGMVNIGHLPGRNTTHPTDMTNFGKIIVGGSFSGPTSGDAFIWDSTNGMRNLQTVLQTEYGLNLTGWTLQNASGITPDGNVIVGHGINPSGKQEAFRVVLDTLISNKYLGQTPPGNVPVQFAPGIVTGYVHGAVAISPKGDEMYWVVNPSTERIMYSKYEHGIWTTPALADFVKDYLTIHNGGPTFSPDGNKLFFYSARPGGIGSIDTWYVERTDSGWSKPINAGEPYNSSDDELTPIFTNKGNAYCVRSNKNHEYNPICFKYTNGKFSDPTPMDVILEYSPWWTIFVSPEEDYLIFAGGSDDADLYVRFKKHDGQWGTPINMGNKLNTKEWERFPVVSPDGKYLFFTRGGSDIGNVFWVSTAIIDSIRKTVTGIHEEKGPDKIENFKLNQNYPNPFNPSTVISYQLSVSNKVNLKIYDTLGREIRTLVDSFQSAGEHSVTWDATNNSNNPVCSGAYFYKVETNKTSIQKKMILIR